MRSVGLDYLCRQTSTLLGYSLKVQELGLVTDNQQELNMLVRADDEASFGIHPFYIPKGDQDTAGVRLELICQRISKRYGYCIIIN